MSGDNVHHNNDTHIPSQNNPQNEQNQPQYPMDIEVEIQRRVNDTLEHEREKTIQSSRYTHYSRDRAMSESSEAPSAQDNPRERCSGYPLRYMQLRALRHTTTPKRT
ncbi:hypothetical protein LIER_25122 [Lithospermum erythrorhizon]|uniref:Uncharacterized protein n=1 Tax=Lithospermum erythrorhizon TaxID=34254 RepID=A0AAV3R6V6_LITER